MEEPLITRLAEFLNGTSRDTEFGNLWNKYYSESLVFDKRNSKFTIKEKETARLNADVKLITHIFKLLNDIT